MGFLALAFGFLANTAFTTSHISNNLLMMTSIDHTDASAYNDYASAAVELSQAHYSPLTQTLTLVRSVRDIDNNKRRKYLYSIQPHASSKAFWPPTELHDRIKIRILSPSGDKIAIVVIDKADDSKTEQQVLEIWTCGGQFLERRISIPKSLHGKIISDTAGGFGSPVWNAQETALVYSAERVLPKTCSFFADESNDKESAENEATNRGGEYTLGLGKLETWGEKYSQQVPLLDLFVVHVGTGKIGRIDNVPGTERRNDTLGGYALGQAVWSPDNDNSIVYVAWDAGGGNEMPRRLGLTYCMQRPSKLCCSRVERLMERLGSSIVTSEIDSPSDKPYQVLTPDIRVARSPRFSPTHSDGSHNLVFLSARRPFDSHLGCFGLDSLPWMNGEPVVNKLSTVVPQVWNPKDSEQKGTVAGLLFPGLFTVELPEKCFLSPDLLLATTQWGSCQRVVRISTADKSVVPVRTCHAFESNSLLTVAPDGSSFVASSCPNSPNTIFHIPASSLCSLSSANVDNLHAVELPQMLPYCASRFSIVNKLPSLGYTFDIHELNDIPSIPGCSEALIVQSILLLPNKNQHPKPAVIVIPHGGPHSASSTSYLPSSAYLCGYGGYALLFVNYRGSVGFGQASVEALPSKCGVMDLQDMIAATEQLKRSGLIDENRIGICGGSHGGFLTAHGTSQYPDYFKAAAMRNPVVDIASMVTSTDIPDWCYYETFGRPCDFSEYRPPTKEELVAMYDCSPVKHINAVKTPTLVALGLSDLRVPPSQGMEWYYSLRSKGVPTKLLTYNDDDHAIAGVVSEADHWLNTKQWFDKYFK